MATTNLDWRPAWNTTYGFAGHKHAAVSDWVRLRDGHLYLGDERFVIFGAATNQHVCAMDDASERTGVPARVAARGHNVVRFLGLDTKETPDGVWKDTNVGDLTAIASGTDRATTTAVSLNALRKNLGSDGFERVYRCVVAGTTGAGAGPTGVTAGQVDGTVTWDFEQNSNGSAYRAATTATNTTAVTLNTIKANKVNGYTRLYRCTTAGNTASGTEGPSGTSSGITDGTVVWAYEQNAFGERDPAETFEERMDEMIANYNALGVRIWMCAGGHYAQCRMGAGLPSSIEPFDDAHWDNSMMWSDEWLDLYKAYFLSIMTRVNTITNVRYIDNPGILVWEFFNENGMGDGFSRGWFDGIVNNVDGAGYWLTELNAKLAAWVAEDSAARTMPISTFPTYAVWDAWVDADKAKLIEFISDTEVARATELKAWLKSYNPNALFCYSETNYSDIRVAQISDITSMHSYAAEASGDTISGPNYTTRGSVMRSLNGSNWASYTPMRSPVAAHCISELGNYGLNRWDYENAILEAVVCCLQDSDGFITFIEGQGGTQSSIVGIQTLTHVMPGWPTRWLSAMLAGPIVKHRMIAPIPDTLDFVLDPANISGLVVANGFTTQTAYRYLAGNISNGTEWQWLARRISQAVGTPQNVSTYTTLKDAGVATGVTVTVANGTVFWRGAADTTPVCRVNVPAAQGWCGTVADGTVGTVTISGVADTPGVCFIRSDGDWPLYSGSAKLFVHMHSYINATGFAGTADGEAVTSFGTEANTRVVMPGSYSITLASGRDLTISGVTATGTLVAISTTWNSGAGTVQFNTSTSYPLYLVEPKTETRKRSIPRKSTAGRT